MIEALARPAPGPDGGARRPRAVPEGPGAQGARQGGRGRRRRGADATRRRRRATSRRRLIEEAGRRGFRLEAAAARLLVERMGEGTLRLCQRARPACALGGAERGGRRSPTSRRWSPTPPRRPPGRCPTRSSPATRPAPRAPPSVWSLRARRSRRSSTRRLGGCATRTPRSSHWRRDVPRRRSSRGSRMHPYAAKMLVRRLRGRIRLGPSRRHLRDRRPGVVDPRRLGVSGRRGADARRAACGRRRRRCGLRQRPSQRHQRGRPARYAAARLSRRAARDFLRAPLLAMQGALLDCLVDSRDELAMLVADRRRLARAPRPARAAGSGS